MRIESLSINLATVREQWTLPEAVETCARMGIPAVDPWRDQVAACGLDTAVRAIRDAGLTVSGYCRGGMFPAADAAGRQAAIDDNRRAIDEAAALGAACLVLVVGGLPQGSRDIGQARAMVRDGLAALLPYARDANMPLAIEPLHPMYAGDRACVNTLAQALDLCDALGDGTGVAIDTYHVWWDPALETQVARAGRDRRILAYHTTCCSTAACRATASSILRASAAGSRQPAMTASPRSKFFRSSTGGRDRARRCCAPAWSASKRSDGAKAGCGFPRPHHAAPAGRRGTSSLATSSCTTSPCWLSVRIRVFITP